ncbi:protease inhibitor I42 family protein [Methanocella arvoryzae]|nr:protease inhibitor I42 family protein [Methanocella arvoryzae]
MTTIAGLGSNGQVLEIHLRERLEIRLPESRISGYMWKYHEPGCPRLQLEDSDYREKGEARFTGLGERWWRFNAIATGECRLVFSLIRPWSAPSQEYFIVVRVS